MSGGAVECESYFLPALNMDGKFTDLPVIQFSSDDVRSRNCRNDYKLPHDIKLEFQARLQARASASLSWAEIETEGDIKDTSKKSFRIKGILRKFRNLATRGFGLGKLSRSENVGDERE
jgi:hypothetical protein